MNIWIQIILFFVGLWAAGWVFRFVGQKATSNAPFFRDMPTGVAFGYVLGAVCLVWAFKYFLSMDIL